MNFLCHLSFSLSFSLTLFPFIFLFPFLSPSCCSSVSLSIFGRSATGVFIWRLPWQHTHTCILQAPFCCQLWCVCCLPLGGFGSLWLLALAIYSAVCCDFATFCGFSTVVDSQAGIGLSLGGRGSEVMCLCCLPHFRVIRISDMLAN